MHTMASGDLDGDGSDAIIFSDHYRNVSEVHIDMYLRLAQLVQQHLSFPILRSCN